MSDEELIEWGLPVALVLWAWWIFYRLGRAQGAADKRRREGQPPDQGGMLGSTRGDGR